MSDITARWRDLRLAAAGIIPTELGLDPSPAEIEAVADDLRALAKHVDRLIFSYGEMLAGHVRGLDLTLFEDVLSNALEGNALFEIELAADKLRFDNEEAAYYARHNRGGSP